VVCRPQLARCLKGIRQREIVQFVYLITGIHGLHYVGGKLTALTSRVAQQRHDRDCLPMASVPGGYLWHD
jgi:heme/copper-type cytochrome/quinol oxidase subunit 3